MKRITLSVPCVFLTLGLLVISLLPAVAQKPDSGKFILNIQENEIGTYTFKSDAQGGTTYEQKLNLFGNKSDAKAQIQAKGGVITSVNYESKPGGKYALSIADGKAVVTLNGGKPKTQPLKEKLYPFDNFAPHVLSSLLRAYNDTKGGTQKLDILIINGGVPVKMDVTAKGNKPRKVAGKMVPVLTYTLGIVGGAGKVEIEVYADSDKRILGWNVPSQKYKAWREGYKEVAWAEEPNDPLLSKPTFEVTVDKGVKISLRDGVKLVADVYRPKEPGKYPVILQRTPYGREKALEANYFAKRGYIFVAQDVRGKFDSEGVFEPFVNEAQDGFDTVEWCGKQEWSSGKVGMIGGSYVGFVQWAAAREGSDYLKCIVPIVSPPDPFFNIPYAYGALFLYPGLWWAQIVKDKGMNTPHHLTDIKKFYTLPLKEIDKAVFGKTIPFYQKWLQNPTNNAYWSHVNFNERMEQGLLKPLPALHVSGWFDGDGVGTKRNYAAMIKGGQANQKLIYGAWPHAVNSVTKIGELDFGSNSLKDLDTLYLRWFDHWLKGVDNGIDREPDRKSVV